MLSFFNLKIHYIENTKYKIITLETIIISLFSDIFYEMIILLKQTIYNLSSNSYKIRQP